MNDSGGGSGYVASENPIRIVNFLKAILGQDVSTSRALPRDPVRL
jgi:hypothetical protein